MKDTRMFVSLITSDNEYQKQQAEAAEQIAARLGISVRIVYADRDAVNQSQQILQAIEDRFQRPHAILVEPVGTGMYQVASAALRAGIGWCVVNREVDYIPRLRRIRSALVFAVSVDQPEVGRIQGRQLGTLVKAGGTALYIEGPFIGRVSQLRTAGMLSTKPRELEVKTLRGDWTENSAYHVMKSWLSLRTSRHLDIEAVGCQNDQMAFGVRRAIVEWEDRGERAKWLSKPITGCDGVPTAGQKAVLRGLLAATVVIPPTMGLAVEMMYKAIHCSTSPPERTLSTPASFPALHELNGKSGQARSWQSNSQSISLN